MSSASSSSQPADPYTNFKFRLKWNGEYMAGLSKVSELSRPKEAGQTKIAPITLERGTTHDAGLLRWSQQSFDFLGNDDGPPAMLRRDLVLEIHNEAGQLVFAYTLYGCWPSEFVAFPDPDSSADALLIERLVLQNEGWERALDVKPPPPPDFS